MIKAILSFLLEASRLKRMPRNGWIYSGVPPAEVESVADHSYNTTLLALLIALDEQCQGKKIDLEKVLIMALLHDLSEAISQDIDRRVGKFSLESYSKFKEELDTKATKKMLAFLPEKFTEKLQKIYQEFSNGKSQEATIVTEADRLETILQMRIYHHLGKPKHLFKEFIKNFSAEKNNYQSKLVQKLARELLAGDFTFE